MRIRLADVEPSPDVFASVMATGVLSIVARKHDYVRISETMGILASLGLVILVALVIVVIVTKRLWLWDLRDPDVTLRLMVFPLGMYSAATYAMGTEIGQRSLRTVSLVFFWDALAAWLIVFVAGLLRLRRALRPVSRRES